MGVPLESLSAYSLTFFIDFLSLLLSSLSIRALLRRNICRCILLNL
jgi:hypothetical protein